MITGGERGIGKECARQLAQRGYTVLIGALDIALAKLQRRVFGR
nr:SDR family NAD(P)-dependent oxidoreductase [Microbacterium halimionae]